MLDLISLFGKVFLLLIIIVIGWLVKSYLAIISMYFRCWRELGFIPETGGEGGLLAAPVVRSKHYTVLERVWSRYYGTAYCNAYAKTGTYCGSGNPPPAPTKSSAFPRLFSLALPGWTSIFFSYSLQVTKRDDIKYVLTHTNEFIKLPLLLDILKLMLGHGLVTSSPPTHTRQRKLLQPLFHSKRVRDSMPLIGQQMSRSIDELESQLESQPKAPIDPVEFFEKMTLRAIVAFAFGDLPNVDHVGHLWNLTTRSFQKYMIFRVLLGKMADSMTFLPAVRDMKNSCQSLRDIVADVIAERRAQRQQQKKQGSGGGGGGQQQEEAPVAPSDLLGAMIAFEDTLDERIDEELMIDEALTVLLAGHETSSNTASWASYFLARRPDLQDKVRQEALAALRDHPEATTLADVARQDEKLVWSRAVVRETLRLRPPAAMLGRQATVPLQLPNSKINIRPGDQVACNLHLLHTDVENWERPLEFYPERFLPPNDEHLDPFAWLPFSAGARNCAGKALGLQETTAILSTMAAKFKWQLHPSDHTNMESVLTVMPVGLHLSYQKI